MMFFPGLKGQFFKKGRASVKVFFSAVNTSGLFENNWSKDVLKRLSMNDFGYPLFKNMSFRNANSLEK